MKIKFYITILIGSVIPLCSSAQFFTNAHHVMSTVINAGEWAFFALVPSIKEFREHKSVETELEEFPSIDQLKADYIQYKKQHPKTRFHISEEIFKKKQARIFITFLRILT